MATAADGLPEAAKFQALSLAEQTLLDGAAVLPLFFYLDRNLIDLSRWEGWYEKPLDQHPWKFIRPKQK